MASRDLGAAFLQLLQLQLLQQFQAWKSVRWQAQTALVLANATPRGRPHHAVGRATVDTDPFSKSAMRELLSSMTRKASSIAKEALSAAPFAASAKSPNSHSSPLSILLKKKSLLVKRGSRQTRFLCQRSYSSASVGQRLCTAQQPVFRSMAHCQRNRLATDQAQPAQQP